MVEFAITLRQKLQEVNKDAFNTFQLRVGISSGPLVSGVIGARKPVYDIWGNTVWFYINDIIFFWKTNDYMKIIGKCSISHGFNRRKLENSSA